LVPPPGVKKQDVSAYVGGRTDDHFAMWQERVSREVPRPIGREFGANAAQSEEIGTHEPQGPAAEFSLDFSAVQIPPGRYLTGPELEAAVHSFLDELETA
jgi:hypothetical protein